MRLKRLLSNKLRVFCEHCTLHGAVYLTRARGVRAAWAAIMFAGVALWGALSHMIWQKYNIDPTVTVISLDVFQTITRFLFMRAHDDIGTSFCTARLCLVMVESTYYRSEEIPFPAVMICDPLPVYGPNAKNISHILSSRGYSGQEIDEFFDSFMDIQRSGYTPRPHIRKMHSLLQDLGFIVDNLLGIFKKPCNVTMVKCRWRSKEYDCSIMFREVVTVIGHCCLFDIAYFRIFAPSNTSFVATSRASQALDVTVNGVKAYPNGTVSDGPVLLYIFDATNTVTMMDSSIALAPSSYFDIDLEIFAIDSSPDVKALSLKTRKCVLPTDPGVDGSYYQKCISTLIMRKVVNYCKCLPFMYTAEGLAVQEYPHCIWERYLCIYSQLEINYADMHSLIRMNDCYQRCDYIEYDSRMDFIRNRHAISSKNNSNTRFAVHYAATTCMKYRREVIYTWDQMLANLGGIFGLCLGGSIISIIEIVWFLFDLLAACMYNSTRAKPTRKIAFVIEKDNIKHDKKDAKFKFMN